MRLYDTARRAIVAALLALGATACSGDDGGGGAGPPLTPAPTNVDPGPNDTSNAPRTIQGTLRLAAGCAALETDTVRYALKFTDYRVGDESGAPVLIAQADDRVVARDGNVVVVTGDPGAAAPDACGTPFTVDSFNSVVG